MFSIAKDFPKNLFTSNIVENSDLDNAALVIHSWSNSTFPHFLFQDLNTATLNTCNKSVVCGEGFTIVTFWAQARASV